MYSNSRASHRLLLCLLRCVEISKICIHWIESNLWSMKCMQVRHLEWKFGRSSSIVGRIAGTPGRALDFLNRPWGQQRYGPGRGGEGRRTIPVTIFRGNIPSLKRASCGGGGWTYRMTPCLVVSALPRVAQQEACFEIRKTVLQIQHNWERGTYQKHIKNSWAQ